jgi:Uncharacterized conserved protein
LDRSPRLLSFANGLRKQGPRAIPTSLLCTSSKRQWLNSACDSCPMTEIQLGYGQRSLPFSFDPNRLHSLTLDSSSKLPLSDVDIGAALDSPIASPPLDELIHSEDSVLIVVSDATRATGSAQIVNLVVRRLVQCGVSPARLAIILPLGFIDRSVNKRSLSY